MKSRLMLVLTFLVIASMLLAACGGGGAAATPTAGTDTQVDEPEEQQVATAEAPAEATEAPMEAPTEAVEEEPTEAVEEEPTEAVEEEPTEAVAEETPEGEAEETPAAEGEETPAAEGEETPEAETEGETTAEETPEAVVAPEGFVIWADLERVAILEPILEQFAEEYGVEGVVQEVDFGQIRDRLKQAGPAGEGPDIIVGAHDWLGELVTNGLVAEMDLGEQAENFYPQAVQAFTYEGTLYGMPYALENVALAYNTELVPEAPTTWEEVAETCRELGDEIELCVALPQGDAYHFFPIQTAFGGYVFGQDEAGNYDPSDVGIGAEGSVAAAEFLGTMVEEGFVQADVTMDVAKAAFQEGNAALFITGPWFLQDIRDSGVPFAITNLPGSTEGEEQGRPFLGVQGFMVSAFSEDVLLAQTFLTEFVATEEVMLQFYEVGGRTPAFIPAAEQVEDEELAAFGAAGENGLPMPAIPEMGSVWSAWGNAITLIFQGSEDPAGEFQSAGEQIQTTIEEGGG